MNRTTTLSIALACLLLQPPTPVAAQSGYAVLSNGDVAARFNSWGLVGENVSTGNASFEVPQGTGNDPLFSSALWVGGYDAGNQLHVAAMMYESPSNGDLWPGPLTNDGTASTTQAVSTAYDQVWCVNRSEIELHTAYHNCLADPNCDANVLFPNYQTPGSFLQWPAMGDVSLGYDIYQAPFYDFNSDGDYQPDDGDVPCIMGDKACYISYNDAKPHLLTSSPPLGLQVQMMPFEYLTGNAALAQTVFMRVHIVNQSANTYTDTRLGLFTDFDLGNYADDYVGTDAQRNLCYVYNADNLDEASSGGPGYGPEPPAFGVVVLKGPLVDANGLDDAPSNTLPAWNGHGFGDQIADNERFGLSWSRYFNNNAGPQGAPAGQMDFMNYLGSAWLNGVPQSYGGTGYSTNPNATPARFVYPGASDPLGVGTGGQAQAPWTELSAGNAPFDRKMVGVMGPFTVEPGEHMDLLFAYVYARASTGGPTSSITALQQRVDSVIAFANTLGAFQVFEADPTYGECSGTVTSIPVAADHEHLELFPVPAEAQVQVCVPTALTGEVLVVRDALGRVVHVQRMLAGLNTVDIATLSKGLYTCELTSAKLRYTGRLIKE